MFSVATAVIVIPDPPAGGEHDTADIRLVIHRNGEIVHRQLYYNVPVAPAPRPGNPKSYPSLAPVSLYLELPAAAQGTGMGFTLPEDGTPPRFDTRRTAVDDVLNDDPARQRVSPTSPSKRRATSPVRSPGTARPTPCPCRTRRSR
jgi:hypothetical protein